MFEKFEMDFGLAIRDAVRSIVDPKDVFSEAQIRKIIETIETVLNFRKSEKERLEAEATERAAAQAEYERTMHDDFEDLEDVANNAAQENNVRVINVPLGENAAAVFSEQIRKQCETNQKSRESKDKFFSTHDDENVLLVREWHDRTENLRKSLKDTKELLANANKETQELKQTVENYHKQCERDFAEIERLKQQFKESSTKLAYYTDQFSKNYSEILRLKQKLDTSDELRVDQLKDLAALRTFKQTVLSAIPVHAVENIGTFSNSSED